MSSLGVNLAASAIWFAIGLGVSWGFTRFRARMREPFWRPFGNDQTILVIGRLVGEAFDAYEPPGMIGIGDVRGLHELTELFKAAHLQPLKIGYANELTPDQFKQNLILLGGSDVNSATTALMNEVGSNIKFVNRTTIPSDPPVLVDERTGDEMMYVPKKDNDVVSSDYGVIIRARNPRNPERWVVIIAGCLGYATWAGVSVTRNKALKHARPDCEIIYKTDISDNKPNKTAPVWGPREIGTGASRPY